MPSMSKDNQAAYQVFHLSDEDNGQTLGASIKKRMSQWSWGQTREAILKRRVQVNGNLCLDQARKVTEKDVVKLWKQSLPKPVQPSHLKIVYVDDFLVVVEKPPGITSTRHFEERPASGLAVDSADTGEEINRVSAHGTLAETIPKQPVRGDRERMFPVLMERTTAGLGGFVGEVVARPQVGDAESHLGVFNGELMHGFKRFALAPLRAAGIVRLSKLSRPARPAMVGRGF